MQKPTRENMPIFTSQILTQCVRYLLDVVAAIEKTAGNMYASKEQNETVQGGYYDYKIGTDGLPYFDRYPIMTEGAVAAGGIDLTPTIENLQRQITTLDTRLNQLNTTVTANKNSADSKFASIEGTLSSLDTRVDALEARV